MSKLYDILKEKFDICYVLNLSDRSDRREHMENQFNILGFEDINTSEWIRYHYTTKFPHNDVIIGAFNVTRRGRFTKPNEFDCSRNHYAMIKECYDRGFKHILIMEDDLRFLKDQNLFIDYINSIPDDYDLIQFGGFSAASEAENILNSKDMWTEHKDAPLWTTSMYALSRKGMEFYIAFMDKFFWVADGPLYKAPLNDHLIKSYASNIPLVIQADKHEIVSDIRDDNNDTINYNDDNVYESRVSLNDYL